MDPDLLATGLLTYVVFLFSTTCHEAAHAWIAKLGGDLTAHAGGQASLNPLPHIKREPFGMVVLPIISLVISKQMIGWASAPYDPAWEQRYPKRAAWMSLAGPGANFSLVLISGLIMAVGLRMHFFAFPEAGATRNHLVEGAGYMDAVGTVVSIFFSLNLLLGTFNLLPIPPFDGYSVLGIFVSEKTALKLVSWKQNIRQYSFLGLVVGWQILDRVFPRIYRLALQMVYPN